MLKFPKVVIVPVLVFGAASGQPSRAAQSEPSQAADPIRCEYVVTADPGAKPTRMCLPQSQWAAKKKQDAADATRIVCHYEEEPGTRFRLGKSACRPLGGMTESFRIGRTSNASNYRVQGGVHRSLLSIYIRISSPQAAPASRPFLCCARVCFRPIPAIQRSDGDEWAGGDCPQPPDVGEERCQLEQARRPATAHGSEHEDQTGRCELTAAEIAEDAAYVQSWRVDTAEVMLRRPS